MNVVGVRHQVRNALLRPAARIGRRREISDSDTVLILQPDHLGDILLSQPAVNRIREQFPHHRLVGVVGPWSEAIARIVWPVDEVVTIDFPGFDRASSQKNPFVPYQQLRTAASTLERLDACTSFVLRPDAWWAAWLASLVTGGPIMTSDDPRVAPFGTHHARVNVRGHATAQTISIASALVNSDHGDRVGPGLAPLTVPQYPDAENAARTLLKRSGVGAEYVVLHPGAGAEVKQWPANRWRHVAQELATNELPVLVTGTVSESELAQRIAAKTANVTSIAGQTPLPILIEILRGAQLVLGPDSGPLHLAVACDTPTVHLFGPSDPGRFGPWGPPHRHQVVRGDWSCSRCGDLSPARASGCGCMVAIQTHTVVCAAKELLRADAHH
ncbi:glycosyltransferase family 9 protein [soil metagenome]